ncbi:FAR1-related sequence 5-like protein [Tanacetum coccineum]
MVVEKLENLEKRCEGFFMDYCQGDGDSLCGLFWADKVAKLNYQRFSDTISFDATFRSNKYRMVFVPFTGLDNHNRSVGSSVCNKSNFKERFCRIVWNERISIDMFEQAWASIMDEFGLGEHKWLCDLCNMRHRWIPAFLRDEDMSGLMRTTSRSESENRYFNRFTNPDLTLVEFIGHFESAMDIQRYTQKKNDHESRYNRPQFRTDLQLEKEAADLFTLNIFYEIQDEIVASIAKCLAVNVEQMGRFKKFCILHLIPHLLAHADDGLNLMIIYGLILLLLRVSPVHLLRIFEDTVDILVPFKNKLDLYRLELSHLLAKAEAEIPESVVIKVPRHSTNKGSGSHTRLKNMDELIQNEVESSKKRRTCFVCGRVEGQNCITCPYKDAINAAANKRTKRSTRSPTINYKE